MSIYRALAWALFVYAVIGLSLIFLALGGCGKPAVPPAPEPSISQQERDLRQQESCAYVNTQTRNHADAQRACRALTRYPTVIEREECLQAEDIAWARIQPKVAAADVACEAGRVSD